MATVIFDMDGVLVDSEPFHLEMEQQLFQRLGIAVDREEHEQYVGMAPLMMWQRIRDRHALEQSADALKALEIEHKVDALRRLGLQPTPGIPELIRRLREDGHTLALASSAPHAYIDVITYETGLRDFFRVCVSGDDVDNGKPEPDIFLRTARLLSAAPADCLVIEDSSNGVRAARAAGMRCVAYRNPGSGAQDLDGADLVVDGFDRRGIERIAEMLTVDG